MKGLEPAISRVMQLRLRPLGHDRCLETHVVDIYFELSTFIFRKLYNDIAQKVLVLSKNLFYKMMHFYA